MYHYEGEYEYRVCSIINVTWKSLRNFFPIVYAKSAQNNALKFNLSSMVFISDG